MLDAHLFGHTNAGSYTGSAGAAGAASAQSAANRAKQDVAYLEDRVDRLSLVCMAMWSLLRDKTNFTEEDLLERVKLMDLLDGVEDGKATKTVSQCTACNRPMNPRHTKCIYCGNAKLVESAFDKL